MQRIIHEIEIVLRNFRIVAAKFAKRLGRERAARARQRRWHKEVQKQEARSTNKKLTKVQRANAARLADRAEQKLALWHERVDKAHMGVVVMRQRDQRLNIKLQHLREKKQQLTAAQKKKAGKLIVHPERPWNPNGLSGPAWMVPWFDKVWASGVHFTIVSWFRTPEYSTSLCQRICQRDFCPGTCAGASSNHSCPPTHTGKPYEGAADVSNYYAVRAALARVGAPLHNDLPYDPVHVSYSGH